jgi:NADP-dependent 3-hydroxy acid dehydrogenase YdfG
MPKTVFITGGSSGIGKSIGDYLTQKGFEVYGSSRSPKKYKDSKFTLVELDVTKPESIQKCMDNLLKKARKIDVLINNAGAGITGPLEEIPMEMVKT